jgi:hypothetical protein
VKYPLRGGGDVKIAQAGCGFPNNASAPAAATVASMLELILIAGQAASALLMLYGAALVLMPVRKAPALSEELLVLRHLQHDA